jgi:hypothetical protein
VKVGEAHLRDDEGSTEKRESRANEKEEGKKQLYEQGKDSVIGASTSFAPSPNASLGVLIFS